MQESQLPSEVQMQLRAHFQQCWASKKQEFGHTLAPALTGSTSSKIQESTMITSFLMKQLIINTNICPILQVVRALLEVILIKFNNMQKERQEAHQKNRFRFIVLLGICQAIIVILYGVFVRIQAHNDSELNQTYYPMFQDVNVMMLIGFGFLMTFVKGYTWSALSYTFFINALVLQLYPLLQGFWHRVFHNHWTSIYIEVNERSFTAASYSVASMLIAFGAVLGKVGPFELLIMSLFGIVGYTLNEDIVYNVLGCFDAGGSMPIHTYGAYFGLATCFILCKKLNVTKKAQTTKVNSTFAMIGTLFLWMFWPSFNAGYFPENGFQRSLVVSNTIISLTGSCLATFIVSSLIHEKFNIEHILNATLAGGVAIGAPSGVVANPGISLTIGIFSGVISTICFQKLSEILHHGINLHDTCGIHNLHGIPGLIGGWTSAMVIASYQTSPGLDEKYTPYVSFTPFSRSYSGQAGIQVACSFISLGIGIGFGLITGAILYAMYDFRNEEFFEDKHYFQVPADEPDPMQESKVGLAAKSPTKLPPINPNKGAIINTEINLDNSGIN